MVQKLAKQCDCALDLSLASEEDLTYALLELDSVKITYDNQLLKLLDLEKSSL